MIRGVTTAVLKLAGTHPSMSEQLTNFATDISSISLHSFMRNVGHGSKRQHFVDELRIISNYFINSIFRYLTKVSNFDESEERCTSISVPEGTKIFLILLILSEKKDANWSANDFLDSLDVSVASEPPFRVLQFLGYIHF